MSDAIPIRELSEAERALLEAHPHVYRQQTAGKHRQDRIDAAAWLERHGELVKRLRYGATVLAFAMVGGCGGTLRTQAIQSVVVSDALADATADSWEAFVSAKIEDCRAKNLATAAEREDCLGIAANGEALASAVASLVIVQNAVRRSVACEESGSCSPDWQALATDAQTALGQIREIWSEVQP